MLFSLITTQTQTLLIIIIIFIIVLGDTLQNKDLQSSQSSVRRIKKDETIFSTEYNQIKSTQSNKLKSNQIKLWPSTSGCTQKYTDERTVVNDIVIVASKKEGFNLIEKVDNNVRRLASLAACGNPTE